MACPVGKLDFNGTKIYCVFLFPKLGILQAKLLEPAKSFDRGKYNNSLNKAWFTFGIFFILHPNYLFLNFIGYIFRKLLKQCFYTEVVHIRKEISHDRAKYRYYISILKKPILSELPIELKEHFLTICHMQCLFPKNIFAYLSNYKSLE